MGIKALEAAILEELREVAKRQDIRLKDIMEWRTGEGLKVQEGETLFYLPVLMVSCAVKLPVSKKQGK